MNGPYRLCKILIERKLYTSKEEMQERLDVFYGLRRLNPEEYTKLTEMLLGIEV